MKPLLKGIIIGIVAVLGVSTVVVYVLPAIETSAYYASINEQTNKMNNPILGKDGKICESNHYNMATGYCENQPIYAIQNNVIGADVKITTDMLWKNIGAFYNQHADDPQGECQWLKERLSELVSLEQSDFNEAEWHELYVVTSKYRNANLTFCN